MPVAISLNTFSMKRVRCPKCDEFITFDETKYNSSSTLIFTCPYCGKQFGIRLGTSKVRPRQDDENPEEDAKANDNGCGSITVIENDYCYKQVLPLRMGDNTIGRYMKGNKISMPIETGDLTMDLLHCVINVSRNKRGQLKYVLRDGPSNHGTFVNGERMDSRERRAIDNGTVFNIGVTTVILNTGDEGE